METGFKLYKIIFCYMTHAYATLQLHMLLEAEKKMKVHKMWHIPRIQTCSSNKEHFPVPRQCQDLRMFFHASEPRAG